MASPQPPQPPEPPNTHLLPTHKSDTSKVTHLASLPPSAWTHLILYNTQTPAHANRPSDPGIDRASGLLTWLQDQNWPISGPVADLLLTLLNRSAETRDEHGVVLVDAMTRLFRESRDWEWVSNLLDMIVAGVEDREWARRVFGDVVREFGGRVTEDVEREWEFAERIQECLAEKAEERGADTNVDATKSAGS